MKRRGFLQSATVLATAAGAATALATNIAEAAEATLVSPPDPVPSTDEPVTRRWLEQRWITDNIIRANGIDWD
jgi:hypothetical protein